MYLFFDSSRTNCAGCHSGGDTVHETIFSDCNYYRTGTFDSSGQRGGGYSMDTNIGDPGRAGVTKDSSDLGRFRTPNLRNLAVGGPYGANGSVKDLFTVVQRYNNGGMHAFNHDRRIQALGLSYNDELDLVSFLQSLTTVHS